MATLDQMIEAAHAALKQHGVDDREAARRFVIAYRALEELREPMEIQGGAISAIIYTRPLPRPLQGEVIPHLRAALDEATQAVNPDGG